MQITLTAQMVITFAGFVAALGGLIAIYNRGYDFVKRQKTQDEDIQEIKAEQAILTYGVLACLKGLVEMGCDGAVKEAVGKIETHLNEKAHAPKK